MNHKKIKKFLPPLLWLLLVLQCAHKGPPPGGPVDRIPPEVVDHTPQANLTHVSLDQEITVTFSEAMDRSSVVDALFISPRPRESPDTKWKGRTLKVTLPEGLQEDRTYVITLGVTCKDLRKNNLLKSYSFAFSTGERIDQGSVSGQVYQDIFLRMGVDLWAYQLSGDVHTDLAVQPPDYVTQTDAMGQFRFDNLGEGRYRCFAVEDLNGDRKFDADTELLAVPSRDVLLSQAVSSGQKLSLRLAHLDTVGPSLKTLEVSRGDKVILYFDEALDSVSAVVPESYRLFSAEDTSVSLDIRAVSLECGSQDRIILNAVPQKEGKRYQLSLRGLQDLFGNQLTLPSHHHEFWGSDLPDTIGPRLVELWPPDSAQGIFRDAPISLCFDEAIEPISAETSIVVLDSARVPLVGQFQWAHGAKLTFYPDQGLGAGSVYSISLSALGLRDLAGNAMAEGVPETWFETVEAEKLGSLSGKVTRLGLPDSGRVFLQAYALEKGGRERQVFSQTGEYRFESLLPGRYLISAFLDLDGNSNFSWGRPIPFIPAEPFWVSQDTVMIRSRWETGGVDVVLER